MYMKKHFAKAFTAILFAGILTVPSCSLWEEDTDPSEREGNGPGELIEYSCSLSPADFETKTVGVDDLPSYYIVGVYDITGTKVGVITNSSSLALYKYAKYSFYAVGGAVTDYTFPTAESGIADSPVIYGWGEDAPDRMSMYITDDGAPVYGCVKRVTPASIASGSVLSIPVKRKIAKFNLTIKTDAAIRKYFNAPTVTVAVKNANIGFFPESDTYATKCEDVIDRYNDIEGESRSLDGISESDVVSGTMSAAGSNPNYYYTLTRQFAVPENMNGSILAGNTDPSLKNEDSLEALDTPPSGVTYLDLAVTYSGSYGVSGTMHYRFYPGADNTSNFDIEGGKTYNITCNLSYNGVFADAEWKIDTASMSDARMIDLQCQSHNTAKGDTLWLKVGYSTGAGYDYSSTPYGAKKIGIFINNKAGSETWTESNISSPYGTNPVSLPSFPMAQRRNATCLTCGNVFHGWPVRYTSSSANTFLLSWLDSHMGRLSSGYLCPNCGTTLFNIASTGAMNAIRQAADGSTINSMIQFGYTTNYYAVPISSAETKSSYLVDVVSYDGHHLAERIAPLGPVKQIPFRQTVDYPFYVAQKRTLTFYVGSLAASARTAVTFRATLTPDGGGSASDVSSWLSSNYDSSSSRWTVTVSAKSPGTVTVEALDSSLDVLGAHYMKVYKPTLVCKTENLYLYPSGEKERMPIYYYGGNGHNPMTISDSAIDSAGAFDRALFSTCLNLSASTSTTYSGLVSTEVVSSTGTTVNGYISGFNGDTMKNLLTNSTASTVNIGTITVSNPIGSSVSQNLFVYNFTPSDRDVIEDVNFAGHYFNVQKSYSGALTFRYYWDANNGRSNSSTNYTTSVISPSANPNSVIIYDKSAGTVYVPAVYNNAIGHAYLYARIVNSHSSEEFLLPIRQTNVMVLLEFRYSKINPEDIYDELYGPDMEWCLYYHDGLQYSFYYRNTNYTISIEIEATDALGCIRYVPTSNMITSYPDTIGEWAKEFYPVSTGIETRDVLRNNSVIYLSCSSTIPSAAWTFIPTSNIDNYQGIR